MGDLEWYSEGLRFECTQCGACCTGAEGYVLVSDEESRAIAARIGMSVEAFRRKYTHMTPAGRSLTEVVTEHGRDCVFLDRESVPGKAVCSLYEDRPMQCRTFPWWPETLRSEKSWARTAKACEGVGRGSVVPIEDIRIDRDAQAAYDARVRRAASR
ncbi:MAG: YkgJ family cysteine cluster protein [Phycisphaerales bacterium]|nr:MAG: YkgJ family cysteine cluster protein [Phycisphaerales bacterium]